MIAILLSSDTPGWVTAFFTAISVAIFYGIKSLFTKNKKDDE